MTTNPNLDLAREWAQLVGPGAASNIGRAAAEVITALPDEWIDADEVRELAFDMDNWDDLSGPDEDRVPLMVEKLEGFAKRLNALFPDPQPRPLADMTREEREACRWMQATFTKSHHEHIITQVFEKKARLLRRADGAMFEVRHDEVIPLPDLPRMVWPDEQATEEDMSIIPPKIDTSTGHDDHVDMTPEDVPEGEPWIVECYGDRHVGTRDPNAAPNWVLARMDGVDVIFAGDHLVTLVSRLVPEVTA